MSASRNVVHLLLAATFLLSAIQVAADTVPATPAQLAAVQGAIVANGGNSGPNGANTLQGTWETRNEAHVLYPQPDGASMGYGVSTPSGCGPNVQYLYDPVFSHLPNPGGMVPNLTGGPLSNVGDITFHLGRAAADTEVYSMATDMFLSSTTTFHAEVELQADGVTLGTATVTSGGSPTAPQYAAPLGGGVFQGEAQGFTLFDSPIEIAAGQQVNFTFHALPGTTNTGDTLELDYGYGCGATSVTLTANTARVNVWSEDLGHHATDAFLAGAGASTTDRTIVVPLAHVNTFGDLALSNGAQRHYLRVVGPDQKVYYDNSGANAGNPNQVGTVNVAADQKWGAIQDDLGLSNNLVSGQNGLRFVEYHLTYPSTLVQEGVYTVEVRALGEAWKVAHQVTVGGTGSALALSPLEQSATKEILLGQKTTFRVVATNTGGSRDVLAFTATPAANPVGWGASVSPASLTLDAGASGEVLVSVVPSSLGRSGDANPVKVVSTSRLSGHQSDPLTLTVKLTDTPQTGVRILTDSTTLRVAPGASRSFPLVIENSGNAHDRFTTSLAGAPLGWTVTLNPATYELDAKSQNAGVLTVTAPADATRGSTFNLNVLAIGIDNAATTASKAIPIEVFLADAFHFGVFDGVDAAGNAIVRDNTTVDAPLVHQLRDEGPDADVHSTCVVSGLPVCPATVSSSSAWDGNIDPDVDYDQSTVFRLVLSNDGDRNDTIQLLPKLLTSNDGRSTAIVTSAQRAALGYKDTDNCEESSNAVGDGLNDFWRFRMFDAANASAPAFPAQGDGTKQGYDAVASYGSLVPVPAHSVKYVYAELGYHWPGTAGSGCSDSTAQDPSGSGVSGARAGDPGPGHAVAIEAVSQNDPSQRGTQVLDARIIGAGNPGTPPTRISSQRYSDQINGVQIGLDANEVAAKSTQGNGTLAQRTASYHLRAVNSGDEMDTIRLSVPQQQDGWNFTFAAFDTSVVSRNLDEGNSGGGRAVGCSSPSVVASNVIVECTMGAGDEVGFTVNATAPQGATIGSVEAVKVTATSKDSLSGSATIAQQVSLSTKALGSFAFNLLPDATSVLQSMYAGVPASMPFTVRNLGTQGDHYQADLAVAPASGSGWTTTFSQSNPLFVPAGKDLNGFLSITPPAGAAPGTQERFRIRVTSLDTPGDLKPFDVIDVLATVVVQPSALNVSGSPPNVVALPGDLVNVTATATRSASSNATTVAFSVDPASLPTGWSAVGPAVQSHAFSGNATSATFQVQTPADALGTSRAAIRILGQDSNGVQAFGEIGVALSSPQVGVLLGAPNGTTFFVAPGATAQGTLEVSNLGIGLDSVALSAVSAPTGWGVAFSPSTVGLQPLETKEVTVSVSAPAGLAAGQATAITVKALSSDAIHSSTIDLNFTTGDSLPVLTSKQNGTVYAAPEETARFVVTVANNGTLGDDLHLVPTLPQAYRDIVLASVQPDQVSLSPGQAQDVQVTVTLPGQVAPLVSIPVTLTAHSLGPFLNATGQTNQTVQVLDFRAMDVDGDGAPEYGVDRDRDASNGFEQYRDPASAAGLATSRSDLASFLDAPTRARLTTSVVDANGNATQVLVYRSDSLCKALNPAYNASVDLDTDCDGRVDHLIHTGDGFLPDTFYDPDSAVATKITLRVDVDHDGSPELFLDTNGDGVFDLAFDLARATMIPLLHRDLDNDGVQDYGVDVNHNGQVDASEPFILSRSGAFVVVKKIDVNGDGQLDEVYDTNADGNPDVFVPAGTTTSIPIKLRDVNGDGKLDWTYDQNGDGRVDHYYNPVTGTTGTIQTGNLFLSALKDHWYIGALFGVVLVLFVVLLAVTRR